ncbi:hypothetical protein V6N11_020738 [Hibiscus sabdariffa]|uniref:Uncharacterized protein n=1 Tax=Hibiscus sabdariffa TaxID=183260 RepID=A0ABR2Q9B7_9ROSI
MENGDPRKTDKAEVPHGLSTHSFTYPFSPHPFRTILTYFWPLLLSISLIPLPPAPFRRVKSSLTMLPANANRPNSPSTLRSLSSSTSFDSLSFDAYSGGSLLALSVQCMLGFLRGKFGYGIIWSTLFLAG